MIDETRTAAPERAPVRGAGALLLAAGASPPPLAQHHAAPFPHYSARSSLAPRGSSPSRG
jgi:hypothetical protein